MAHPNSHLLIPIELPLEKNLVPQATEALAALFQAVAPNPVTIDGKQFAYAAFPTSEAAAQALRKEGDRIIGNGINDNISNLNRDICAWVSITSINDPIYPGHIAAEALQPSMLHHLQVQSASAGAQQALASFEALCPSLPFRKVLLEMVLNDIKGDMDFDIPDKPYTETIDASDRGRTYVGKAWNVDPVATMLTAPHAALDAAVESAIDYISEQDRAVVKTAMKRWQDAKDDLTPSIEALGYKADDIQQDLEEWCEEALSNAGGAVDIAIAGSVAIAAEPMRQYSPSGAREPIYITFDGITSSSMNAVPDENYMAMLDALQVNVRDWIGHLAERAGLQMPNWNIDLKAIIADYLPQAKFDPETGYQWQQSVIESMRNDLRDAIFFTPSPPLPDNLLSHKDSWPSALARLIELEPDAKQKFNWQGEHRAMLDMYEALDQSPAVVPGELTCHRDAWLAAMQRLIDLEPASNAEDANDQAYWMHERQAMLTMYADWDTLQAKALPAAIPARSNSSLEFTQGEIDAIAAARLAYRQSIRDDAPQATQDNLKRALDEALADTRIPEEDDRLPTAEYLLDIALEVLKAQAEDLDAQWLKEHGIDGEQLASIMSSKEQMQAFPQLKQMPDYYMALVNMPQGSSLSYDWTHAPHRNHGAPLIEHQSLASVLENCNYNGNVVFAFDCDLDLLQKLGAASTGEDAANKHVRIDGAYFHIHDYNNGAGDGEQLSGTLSIPIADLTAGKWRLSNDTLDSYGIQSVYSQFLASDCNVKIIDSAPTSDKRLDKHVGNEMPQP